MQYVLHTAPCMKHSTYELTEGNVFKLEAGLTIVRIIVSACMNLIN